MRFLPRLLLVVGLCLSTSASAFWQSRDSGYNQNISGFTPACSQSATWLARTSGLSTTERNAYDTMICGMVTDGTITGDLGASGCGALIDVFNIYATNTTTTALLNICGTSFTSTTAGTITFSADNGFTSNGTTGVVKTGFIPSTAASGCGNGALACNYVRDSATVASYGLTSRTTSQTWFSFGSVGTSSTVQIISYSTVSGNEINAGSAFAETKTNANGFSVITRTAATTTKYYHYNSTATPTTTSDATSSAAVSNREIYFCARNNAGSVDGATTDQQAAAIIGGGWTLTQSNLISTRINQYMIDVGAGYHY